MEWVGFVTLVGIGLYFVIGGVVGNLVNLGFTGRHSVVMHVATFVGGGCLYLAWHFKPFAIIVN